MNPNLYPLRPTNVGILLSYSKITKKGHGLYAKDMGTLFVHHSS